MYLCGICYLQLSWQIVTVKARKVERTISNFPNMKNNDIECILISYLNLVHATYKSKYFRIENSYLSFNIRDIYSESGLDA